MGCFVGVPRETDKERKFADFDIFDDPETPYSTFNFQYSNQAFKQLHDLMEFNTLNNIEVRSILLYFLLYFYYNFIYVGYPQLPLLCKYWIPWCYKIHMLLYISIIEIFWRIIFSTFHSNDTLSFTISKYK